MSREQEIRDAYVQCCEEQSVDSMVYIPESFYMAYNHQQKKIDEQTKLIESLEDRLIDALGELEDW